MAYRHLSEPYRLVALSIHFPQHKMAGTVLLLHPG